MTNSIHRDLIELARIRADIAYLDVKFKFGRWYMKRLKAGFNPSQPRVPAGNPDGGQWTSTGGSSGGSSASGTESASSDGSQSWESLDRSYRRDGSLAAETVVNDDGIAIQSEYSRTPDETGWDERHTVRGPDGTSLTFQNLDSTQVILGADNQILSANTWTSSGPEPAAVPQPAFAPAAAAVATVELAVIFYAWYLSKNQRDLTPVIALARNCQQVPDEEGELQLAYVGTLTQDQVNTACKKLVTVKETTDEAAAHVTSEQSSLSPQQYGTAVHKKVEVEINKKKDPNFTAEVSISKMQEELGSEVRYGQAGTIRVDVLENTKTGTVCVYDIKTGKSGLSAARFAEISRTVHRLYKEDAQRIIITEVRPTR